jgi:acetolactate synthase small subunit
MALRQQVKTQATATTEVVLEPALKKKLEQRLDIYRRLDAEYEVVKAKLEKEAKNIEGYFEQVGAQSITVERYATITEVKGTTSKLDKKLFVQQGGTLQQLENATVTTPKKAYILITLAKP